MKNVLREVQLEALWVVPGKVRQDTAEQIEDRYRDYKLPRTCRALRPGSILCNYFKNAYGPPWTGYLDLIYPELKQTLGIQDGGRISRLIATTALAHPQTTRGSHSPAAADAADAVRRQHGPLRALFGFLVVPARIGPQQQAPEGPARIGERGARSRPVLLSLSAKRDSRRFLAILVGVWGVWDARMAPKIIRTPRSLRARQNQDPGGTRKDKKLPVPGSKEHSNLHVKGGPHKTTDMEKDARYSVPTMFSSMMRPKQRSTGKAACDAQSNVLGVNDEHVPVAFTSPEAFTPMFDAGGREPPCQETASTSPGNSGEGVALPPMGCAKLSEQELKESNQRSQESIPEKCVVQSSPSSCKLNLQQIDDMVKSSTIYETTPPAPAQRGKEAKPTNTDQGPFDTAESFFSLSDQSKDSDLDEEIPLTDSDIESSSAASIWVSNYLTCRRKSVEQTEARSSSGAKLRRDPIKPQEEDGEMQWDYMATQQAFSKGDSACSTLVPPVSK
ncbi:hypothetical protein NDU88_002858 [Pleurodeles waltl]|uniref:Uncharacterized protein n=1 Tax=Pleurodeles waltl TaxID=8319 RepID=A0AAV7W4J8_PLEWA|nr:hypothetical protein NDU88_002858 [Pleurodeles waltl]